MKFTIERRKGYSTIDYESEEYKFANAFTEKLIKEIGDLAKAVVIFGSTARKHASKEGDIDVLVVIDDVSIVISETLAQTIGIIIQRLINETSPRLHITTLRISNFWEYVRAGDPVAINMLRDGFALVDCGFFGPLQLLLHKGKVRPTVESVWTYYARAPRTLRNAQWHLLQATLDLYWAVIDAAHAALMHIGEVPPTPAHVADLLEERLVKHKKLEKKYAQTMRNFYHLAKMIMHNQISEVKGAEFENYLMEAQNFVERMKHILDDKTLADAKR